MFDIGFWEIAFIGIIALIVIGPERLPGVAHRVGIWIGKVRRMLNEVMVDVKKEMKEYDVDQVKTLGEEFKSASNQLEDITQSTSDALGLQATSAMSSPSYSSEPKTGKATSKSVSKKSKATTTKTIIKEPIASTKIKTKTKIKTASKKPTKTAHKSAQPTPKK